MADAFSLKAHRSRAAAAWDADLCWQSTYAEAYQYAIPFRRPEKWGDPKGRIDNLFDDTALSSTFHGAGSLKEDLFPSGQAWFKLAPGPLAKLAAANDNENAAAFARNLSDITDQVVPWFQTGEFDQAATEMCLDLYAGTGAILPLAGDDENPVRFVCIPIDELAIENGPFNELGAAYWKTELTRRAIKAQFPRARFPAAFLKAFEGDAKGADEKIQINQDFVREGKRWKLYVWIKDCNDDDPPIYTETYRTQPIIAPRYHRVPGEVKGRGPILLALPAIKTSNKAQELTLKAFAIQMLGIWGYRPGGAFNPDTSRIAPGAMWPMNSTGGVLGPDVQRLDPATGRVDMANLVTGNLSERIRIALHDDRVESKGKTPISASEYVGTMTKMRNNYIGAFGRLVHEIIPPLIRRVMEILYKAGLLATDLKADQLFVQVKVTSPLANATKLDHLKPILDFLQLLAMLQENPRRFIKIDDLLDDLRDEMEIKGKYQVSKAERADVDKQLAAQQANAAVTEALVKKPELVAGAMGAGQDQAQAQAA